MAKTKWYPGKNLGKLLGIQKKRKKKIGGGAEKQTTKQAGRIRKGAMKAGKGGTEVTKGGVYAKYEKKSKAAGSFKSAFAKNCKGKGAGDSFNWDGRSYSCARASDKKKAAPKKPVSETKKVSSNKPVKATKKNKELVAIPELGPGKKYTKRQKTLYYKSKR